MRLLLLFFGLVLVAATSPPDPVVLTPVERAQVSDEQWAQLAASGAAVVLARCDMAEPSDARRLMSVALPLGGVWHAAGVLADGLVSRQSASTLQQVYGPKAHGAWALQLGVAASVREGRRVGAQGHADVWARGCG